MNTQFPWRFLLLALVVGAGNAAAQDRGLAAAPGSILLPSESRHLPLVQRVGRFHAGLVLCELVPSLQVGKLKTEAKAQLATGLAPNFDEEYAAGAQQAQTDWGGMETVQRVIFCRQVSETWTASDTANEPANPAPLSTRSIQNA